jgi:Ca2+-transporting ATPase
LLFSVSVAIAAVPEGLPTTITIALALGATVLARKKAIIKRLSSVETLGAVTTICSDKTGTLTRNEMTVREIYLPDRSIFEVSGVGYNPRFGKIDFVGGSLPGSDKEVLLEKLLEVCAKCNEAKLEKKHNKYFILGDPTEGALLTLVAKSKIKIAGTHTQIFPFDSDRKMMSIVTGQKKARTILVKGSPDQVLEKCTHWFDGKKLHKITPDKREHIQSHYERMAQKALRVLAFAGRSIGENEIIKSEKEAEKKLVFYGLVGMIDPPREEVRDAVERCMTAGIRVIVITGDFGITAEAVAQELGIIAHDNEAIVLTGPEVKKMSDAKLSKILKSKKNPLIFARSLPDQKMRIVKLLQKQGEVVAMTGDGVNDAPALKVADIGVAMGITGTEVSKEAATMILADDSFASIVTAIGEGRRIYENLKKFVWFIFSCNIGELFLIFAAIIFQFPLPLTAVLILCIDLGTDILPAIALGVDGAEDGLMKKKPRDPKKRLMDRKFTLDFILTGSVIGISIMLVYIWTIQQDGWMFGSDMDTNWPHAQTVAFTALVFVQLVNAFSARSEKQSLFKQNLLSNHFLVLAVITSILLVMVMIYIPFLNTALGTTPLNRSDWIAIMIASFAPLVFLEIRKYFRRRRNSILG